MCQNWQTGTAFAVFPLSCKMILLCKTESCTLIEAQVCLPPSCCENNRNGQQNKLHLESTFVLVASLESIHYLNLHDSYVLRRLQVSQFRTVMWGERTREAPCLWTLELQTASRWEHFKLPTVGKKQCKCVQRYPNTLMLWEDVGLSRHTYHCLTTLWGNGRSTLMWNIVK